MATTLSPEELRKVRIQAKDQPEKPIQLYEEGTKPAQTSETDIDDNNDASKQQDIGKKLLELPIDVKSEPEQLRSTCEEKEGGTCTSFRGCDTAVSVYKGYCTTDYSQVCCVSRKTVCEMNDGICTDDGEACVAAGEIMGRKYNLKFYTWMPCNRTHVCCRPSRKSNIFARFSEFFEQEGTTEPPVLDEVQGEMEEPDEATLREMYRRKQLAVTTRDRKKSPNDRLSKIARGKAYKAPAGFPKKDIVSSSFKGYPNDNKQERTPRKLSSKSRRVKPRKQSYKSRSSGVSRTPRTKKRRKKLSTAPSYRPPPAALIQSPVYHPAPIPVVSPYSSMFYGLPANSQTQQLPHQQSPASYLSSVPNTAANNYLSDHQGLSNLNTAYSGQSVPSLTSNNYNTAALSGSLAGQSPVSSSYNSAALGGSLGSRTPVSSLTSNYNSAALSGSLAGQSPVSSLTSNYNSPALSSSLGSRSPVSSLTSDYNTVYGSVRNPVSHHHISSLTSQVSSSRPRQTASVPASLFGNIYL